MTVNCLRPAARRNIYSLFRFAPKRLKTQFIRSHSSSPTSVSPDELTHFSSLASSWWDPLGPSRILHLMNPLRHEFIATCLRNSGQGNRNMREGAGLEYLDIGCGGGIFAESLARTIPLEPSAVLSTATNATSLVAIDPSPMMIKVALSHARSDPLLHSHLQSGRFKYENTTLENLSSVPRPASSEGESPASPTSNSQPTFDVITLFEVLEHVDPSTSSPRRFLQHCFRLLKPGGWLIGSTIARTWPSFVVNQMIAEAPWPIGVVPRGTHEWSKFVNPEELREWAEQSLAQLDRETPGGSDVSRAFPGYGQMRWECAGAMYFPGLGWKIVPGAEKWGNYFWGVQIKN